MSEIAEKTTEDFVGKKAADWMRSEMTASMIMGAPDDGFKEGFNEAMTRAKVVLSYYSLKGFNSNEAAVGKKIAESILSELDTILPTNPSTKEEGYENGYTHAIKKAKNIVSCYERGEGLFQM